MSIRSVIGLVAGLTLVGCADSANLAEDAPSAEAALEGGVGGVRGIHRFAGIDPSLPTTDLQRLRVIVGATPVVGLGESVHASGGYHALQERLVKFMVQEMGFRVLTLETARWRAEPLSAYLASCQGDPTDVLVRSIYPAFTSTSMRNIVTWMCQWNTEHPQDPVRFTGFDMREPWADHIAVEAFLHEGMPADAEALYAGLSTCDAIKAVSRKDYNDNYANLPYPKESLDSCHRGLDAIEAYWNENECDIVKRTSERALGLARIAHMAFRQWQSRKFYRPSSFESYQGRDTSMAYTIANQWKLDGRPKTIVWAHNGHLQHTVYGPEGHDPHGAVPMGAQLKKELGRDYMAIAMVGYEVGFLGAGPDPEWDPPPVPGSVEAKLHAFGEPYLLVDLKRVSPRFLEPGKEYVMSTSKDVPGNAFGAAFYFDRTEAMTDIGQ
ncbi:erythromycin esterase family protein [Pendulispora rubella]|uniref:Erythromycin esterase family protein n=1 Tax=Pendulispora rubella TaxID=2741070 RepID=A0ABZ2KS80_9BACT